MLPQQKNKIVAIVPAYNESKRIVSVLKELVCAEVFDDIVVVDDGSNDDTGTIANRITGVRVIRNEKNIGKAQSMDRGVRETSGDIIFFCDADLQGFSSDMVKHIIEPVQNGQYDMFIGLRHNLMQQAVHAVAINSGERAVRRSVWERLPDFFKTRFRIETGLNYYARAYGRGYGHQTFPYMQTLKEKKYGLMEGTWRRWQMNFDVFIAFVYIFVVRFVSFYKKLASTKKERL